MTRTFEPKAIARGRGQILYRYRQGQTYDHANFIGQVIGYAHDEAVAEPKVDAAHVIGEAMRLVAGWRKAGMNAEGAEPSSDRAPEFPPDEPLAAVHYQIVVPGKVFTRVWPLSMRCANCGRVWEAEEPRVSEPWPPQCPRCRNVEGNHQLQFLFVHECGYVAPCLPPTKCEGGPRHVGFRLNDRVSRFQDFRWECLTCSGSQDVRFFCTNPGCNWTSKMMALQVHTASSAFAGHGVTIVNVPLREHADLRQRPEFVIAALGRWLGECTDADADRMVGGPAGAPDPAIVQAIAAMEAAGLRAQADALRAKFVPLEFGHLRSRVAERLGFDPVEDAHHGLGLVSALETYEQVLRLPRLTVADLQTSGPEKRRDTYSRYPDVLRRAGFDPAQMALVKEFPVTYVAVGYSRGGFAPEEADLVAYRGRAAHGDAVRTLLFANPTNTEALVFALDRARVAQWLIANGAATAGELRGGADVGHWFAAQVPEFDGRLPPPWSRVSMDDRSGHGYGAQLLFRLLHSASHQILRAVAVDSGFSETGLSEYLFPMALAFAIYPNGGSEFTIGGLRTVIEQNLDQIVQRALDNDGCLYDPNCMQGNRGVDHGCLQLPETACQCWNWHLSRWELFGEPVSGRERVVGYWDPSLATQPHREVVDVAAAV